MTGEVTLLSGCFCHDSLPHASGHSVDLLFPTRYFDDQKMGRSARCADLYWALLRRVAASSLALTAALIISAVLPAGRNATTIAPRHWRNCILSIGYYTTIRSRLVIAPIIIAVFAATWI